MTNIESNKRKVLLVSFQFPPQASMAAIRLGKFAKYLPQFGWEPIILTRNKTEDSPSISPLEIDDSSIIRTPYSFLYHNIYQRAVAGKPDHQKATVQRIAGKGVSSIARLLSFISRQPSVRLLIPDVTGWYPHAIRSGHELLKREDVEIVFSSSPPFVSHLVASHLHRRTNIPWIAEFRDLWAQNPYIPKLQPFQSLEEHLEKSTMRGSNLLITVSTPLAKELEQLHNKETVIITNGFDEEDYTEIIPLTSKFTITYTGSIYHGRQEVSSLLEAVKLLQAEGRVYPENFELRFFGNNVIAEVAPMVKKYNLHELVKTYGLVPFTESIERQRESAALLLLGWNDPREKGIYTGKLFEYLGAKRPILAIGLKGDVVDELLNMSGTGTMLTEVEEVKAVLDHWLDEFETCGEINSYYNPNESVIAEFSRKKQAQKLARLFDETCHK